MYAHLQPSAREAPCRSHREVVDEGDDDGAEEVDEHDALRLVVAEPRVTSLPLLAQSSMMRRQ